MTVYFSIDLFENHVMPRISTPSLFLCPTDGRGLLARHGEYKVLENDAQLNEWVNQLCQPADTDNENRRFIPVKTALWKNQFQVVKAQSLHRVKQIIDLVDLYPDDALARVLKIMKSNKVLAYHKALLGAHVQNQVNKG